MAGQPFSGQALSESVLKSPIKLEPTGDVKAGDTTVTAADKNIVTTAAELAAFESIRMRLAFLSKGRVNFYDAISKVNYRDYQGKMVVFYLQERKGRLVDIIENRDGIVKYVINDGGDITPFTDLSAADERLAALFEKRIVET